MKLCKFNDLVEILQIELILENFLSFIFLLTFLRPRLRPQKYHNHDIFLKNAGAQIYNDTIKFMI
jgi:hypothetical protein